jgi:hypothetical protein
MAARSKSLVREYVEAIAIAVALALVIRSFVVQAFKIPSGSMIPTLLIGDHLLVNKLVYRFRLPERGEVSVFKFPQDRKTDFIKRVVALPGDDVELRREAHREPGPARTRTPATAPPLTGASASCSRSTCREGRDGAARGAERKLYRCWSPTSQEEAAHCRPELHAADGGARGRVARSSRPGKSRKTTSS